MDLYFHSHNATVHHIVRLTRYTRAQDKSHLGMRRVPLEDLFCRVRCGVKYPCRSKYGMNMDPPLASVSTQISTFADAGLFFFIQG